MAKTQKGSKFVRVGPYIRMTKKGPVKVKEHIRSTPN